MSFKFFGTVWFSILMSSCIGYASLPSDMTDDEPQKKKTSYEPLMKNQPDSDSDSDSYPDEQTKIQSSDKVYHAIQIDSKSEDLYANELIELKRRILALENSKLSWSHTGTYLMTGFCMLIASSLEAFEVCPNLASFLFIFSGVIFTLRGMQMVYKNCRDDNSSSPDDSLV